MENGVVLYQLSNEENVSPYYSKFQKTQKKKLGFLDWKIIC